MSLQLGETSRRRVTLNPPVLTKLDVGPIAISQRSSVKPLKAFDVRDIDLLKQASGLKSLKNYPFYSLRQTRIGPGFC